MCACAHVSTHARVHACAYTRKQTHRPNAVVPLERRLHVIPVGARARPHLQLAHLGELLGGVAKGHGAHRHVAARELLLRVEQRLWSARPLKEQLRAPKPNPQVFVEVELAVTWIISSISPEPNLAELRTAVYAALLGKLILLCGRLVIEQHPGALGALAAVLEKGRVGHRHQCIPLDQPFRCTSGQQTGHHEGRPLGHSRTRNGSIKALVCGDEETTGSGII